MKKKFFKVICNEGPVFLDLTRITAVSIDRTRNNIFIRLAGGPSMLLKGVQNMEETITALECQPEDLFGVEKEVAS